MVNTYVATGLGEHWLAFYAFRDSSKIEMFDFFANPFIFTVLIHFLFIFLAVAFNHSVARFADILPFYLLILGFEIIYLII